MKLTNVNKMITSMALVSLIHEIDRYLVDRLLIMQHHFHAACIEWFIHAIMKMTKIYSEMLDFEKPTRGSSPSPQHFTITVLVFCSLVYENNKT